MEFFLQALDDRPETCLTLTQNIEVHIRPEKLLNTLKETSTVQENAFWLNKYQSLGLRISAPNEVVRESDESQIIE